MHFTYSNWKFFFAILFLVGCLTACKTKRIACPAYNMYPHRAFADSTDPSNAIKQYWYTLVVEGGEDSVFTNATDVSDIVDGENVGEMSNEEKLHENDLGKIKEEEWKPLNYFNIKMKIDSTGMPTDFKEVKYKYNGLVDKKKPKNSNVDKELAQ